MGETICNFFTRKVAYLKNIPYLCSPISSPRMNALSDTLYYALQNLEAQMVMQHNARDGWSCRRIVRAGVDVAGMMLGDDEVEEHRDAYLSMVCKRMSGDTRETIITLIMMAALFNLMPTDRQAKRCKAALSNNWADEMDDIYRAYCKAVDKQIDCQMEKQPSYTFTITVMKTEQPQTIINVAGNYIAQQHIDIHDNPHATIYATAPQDNQPDSILPPENDYTALVRWLEFEKLRGNDYYAEADCNRTKLCRNLLKIIGWEPNQDSLRKAQNR